MQPAQLLEQLLCQSTPLLHGEQLPKSYAGTDEEHGGGDLTGGCQQPKQCSPCFVTSVKGPMYCSYHDAHLVANENSEDSNQAQTGHLTTMNSTKLSTVHRATSGQADEHD